MSLLSVRERINALMQQQREEAPQPTSRAVLEDNADYNIEAEPLEPPTSESPDEVEPIEIPEQSASGGEQPDDVGRTAEPAGSVPDEADGEPDLPDVSAGMDEPAAPPANDGPEPTLAGEESAIEPPESDAVDMPDGVEWYDPGPEFMQQVEAMFKESEAMVPDDVVGQMEDAMEWRSVLLDRRYSLE